MSGFTEEELKVFDYSAQFEFKEPPPTLNTDVGMFIVIDNLPKAPKDKLSKLEVLINKLLSLKDKVQVIRLELTANEQGDGAGYGFAEFKDEKTAQEVVHALDGFEIDKKMKLNLKLNLLSDFEKYQKSSSQEYVPKVYKEPSFLGSWLLDKQARDQFAIRYYDTTEIMWNEAAQKPNSVFKKEKWSENLEWSPLGTYVATFHDKGIVVWGGEKFEKQAAFAHPHAKKIDFSPKEKFIVTWNEDKEKNVVFWDVRTGKSRDVLTVPIPKAHINEIWPIFKWSHDDKFVARLGENTLHITNTKTWAVDVIKLDKISDFCWSPTSNTISYWVPENGAIPAKIALLDYPSKREIRSKNFFKVSGVTMNWHPNGDRMYFKITSEAKKSSGAKISLEIFFIDIKDIPITSITYDTPIVFHAWEPKGTKLSIITADAPNKNTIHLYGFVKADPKLHGEILGKNVDNIIWSPRGTYFVLTNTKQMAGALEFWNADTLEFLGAGEHFMVTDMQWDPTGRYFASSVSYTRHQSENGYIIWSVLGRQLNKLKTEKFYQFLWRPRPPSLVNDDEERKIFKDLSRKKDEIRQENRAIDDEQKKAILEKKTNLLNQWKDLKEFLHKIYLEQKEKRRELGYVSDTEDDYVTVEPQEKQN